MTTVQFETTTGIDSLFWEDIKRRIKARNKDNKSIETWLDPVSYVETVGTPSLPRLILGVPSALHQYFVVENLLDKIYAEVADLLKKDFEVDLVVTGMKALEPANLGDAFSANDKAVPHQQQPQMPFQQAQSSMAPSPKADLLNADYSFSTFVVGRNTEFAHAASYNVAQNPGAEGYNPLFICGPVGMGKTHLLHAVGNQIRLTHPYLKIMYVSAEKFLNECVSSIRRYEMDKFRQK